MKIKVLLALKKVLRASAEKIKSKWNNLFQKVKLKFYKMSFK